MNNGKNLNVKEKMASLDTLSAGIVFGKEDAWDKLQARMDAKPAKRIPLKYWLAAAAMLLLFVTIVTIYNAPEKQVAKNEDKREIKEKENNIAVAQPAAQVIAQPALVTRQRSAPTAISSKKQTTKMPVVQVPKIQPEITQAELLPVPEVKQATGNISIAKTTEPSIPQKKQMKVVHVNDLGTEPAQAAPPIAANSMPESPTKKIRVVHLNDVNAQQQTLDNYLRQTKANFAVSIPFFNSGSVSSTPSNNSENHTLHHSLKFKIN